MQLNFNNSTELFNYLFELDGRQPGYGMPGAGLHLQPSTLINWAGHTAIVMPGGWLYNGVLLEYEGLHVFEFLEALPWVD